MKKFLLAFGVLATLTASAANQYGSKPAEGFLNTADNSGGIASIEIDVNNAVINRNCTLYATLSKGGQIIKAIPASNTRMVYTYQEFDRTEVGTPHITFYNEANSPASTGGNFVVTIPSNFFTVNGKPNARLEYSFTVEGDGVTKVVTPTPGASITEFTTLSINFENASRIQYTGGTTGINIEYADPENDEKTLFIYPKDVTVDGTVLTATFDPYTVEGQIFVNVNSGVVRYQEIGNSVTKTMGEQLYRYYIAPAIDNGFTLTPGPATVTSLKPYKSGMVTSTVNGSSYQIMRSDYFDLKLPEGYTCGNVAARRVVLAQEQADGTLKNTSKYFNNWAANSTKDAYTLYLTGDENTEVKLAPGKYWLVIPSSSFYVMAPGATAAAPYATELKFGPWIVEGEPAQYTVTPSEEPVDAISTIQIKFDEGSDVVVNKIGWFTIMEDVVEYDVRGVADGNVVTLTISPALTTPGEYKLISEASNIKVNGVDTAVSATFTVIKSFITELNLLCNGEPAQGEVVEDEDYGNVWAVSVHTPANSDVASVTFELPLGYDEVYTFDYEVSTDRLLANKRIPADDILAAGFQPIANNTIENLSIGTHFIGFTYGSNGDFLVPSMMTLTVLKGEDNESTGVNEVVAAEEAEYYTLQGVKVANPEKGIYIKVANGKAVKVNL